MFSVGPPVAEPPDPPDPPPPPLSFPPPALTAPISLLITFACRRRKSVPPPPPTPPKPPDPPDPPDVPPQLQLPQPYPLNMSFSPAAPFAPESTSFSAVPFVMSSLRLPDMPLVSLSFWLDAAPPPQASPWIESTELSPFQLECCFALPSLQPSAPPPPVEPLSLATFSSVVSYLPQPSPASQSPPTPPLLAPPIPIPSFHLLLTSTGLLINLSLHQACLRSRSELVSPGSLPNSNICHSHGSGPPSLHRLSIRLKNPVVAPFRLLVPLVTLQLHPPTQPRPPADSQPMLAMNLLLPVSHPLPAPPEPPDPPDPPVFLLLSLSFVVPSSISPPPPPLLTPVWHPSAAGLASALRMAPWIRALPQLFVSQSPSVAPPLYPPPQLAVDDNFLGFVRSFTALCRPFTEIFKLCSKFFVDSCVLCWASLSWLFEGVLPTKSPVPELLVPSDNYCLFFPKVPLSLSGLVEQDSSVLQGLSSRFIVLPAFAAGFFSAFVADIFSGFSSESNALTNVSDTADQDIHGILVFFDSSCFLLIKCIYFYLVGLASWLAKL